MKTLEMLCFASASLAQQALGLVGMQSFGWGKFCNWKCNSEWHFLKLNLTVH